MKRKKQKGFTVIELVIVAGILAILAVLSSSMVVASLKNYRVKNQSSEMEEKAAAVLREFEQNIRAASKIESISANQIVYYRFYDGTSTSPTKVRYFMEGGQFKVGVTPPFGVEPIITYPSDTEKIELVVGDVVNPETIFKYFDGNNNEIVNYGNIPAVAMIGITIELDRDSNNPPAKTVETTKVNLRNMKRNL